MQRWSAGRDSNQGPLCNVASALTTRIPARPVRIILKASTNSLSFNKNRTEV